MKRLVRRLPAVRSLSARLWLGSVALILLTTLSAGVPAFWLTRTQLERQAWSQVETARSATRSLLTAEEERLKDHLLLFTERPTLQELTRTQADDALRLYMRDFQAQSGLDVLALCTADGRAFAGDDRPLDCAAPDRQRFTTWNDWPVLLVRQAVIDSASGRPLGAATVGIRLGQPFLEHLVLATGAQHSLAHSGGKRLVSSFADGSIPPDAFTTPHHTLTVDGRRYYAAYLALPTVGDDEPLVWELAVPVDALVATVQRAFSILALSTLGVGLLGFVFSIWFVGRVNAPLLRLTAAAEQIGRGDLTAHIPRIAAPAEFSSLADALQRSRAGLLDALHERSEVAERLETILQSVVEGVVTCDEAFHITFWSAGAHRLLEWSAAEAVGRPVTALLEPTDSEAPLLEEQLTSDGRRRRLTVRTRNGRTVILALTISSLRTPAGVPNRAVLVFRDITEDDAVHRLRSYFLANISHEFRTPLSTLIASMELLLDEREPFTLDEVRQLLRPSHLSLIGLQTLIDNLLESSSIEAGRFALRPRSTALNQVIAQALRIVNPLLLRRRQALSLVEPARLPELWVDPARLTQVLVNLLNNASKYSPIGAPIELTVDVMQESVRVAVADRGAGIPAAEREQIFQRFVRLDRPSSEQYGVGLGLYVVKTVVEAHGGRLGIEDRPDGGSIFWFELNAAGPVQHTAPEVMP